MADLHLSGRVGHVGHAGHVLHQSEVEDLRRPVAGDHHVLRLQIAMHNSRGMRGGQPVGDACGNRQEFFQRQRSVRNDRAQRLAANQLHHQPCLSVARAEIVDGDDVAVIEGRGASGFAFEAREPVAIVGQLVRKNLDRYLPPETHVARAIDLPHAARPDRASDLVRPEARAGFQSHGLETRISLISWRLRKRFALLQSSSRTCSA